MNLLRSATALANACEQVLDPELQTILGAYASALEEFGDDLEATILIIEAEDTLADVETAYGDRLVADGQFAFAVEVINRGDRWFDVVRIISDDGSGIVLLIEAHPNTDSQLLAACNHALISE